MQRKSLIKCFLIFMLSVAIILPSTGCSKFLEDIASNQAEKMVTESLEEFLDSGNPESMLPYIGSGISDDDDGKDHSSRKGKKRDDKDKKTVVELPALTEEQLSIVKYSFKNSSFKVSKIKINDDRSVAKVTVKFEDFINVDSLDVVGTEDEIKSSIDDLHRIDFEIVFKLVRNEDEEWVYSNLDELWDLTVNGYKKICFLDENGNPVNLSEAFMNMVVVANYWFDAKMANPLSENSVSKPDALMNVFYLNQPISATFTVKFLRNGEEVYSSTIELDNDITIECDVDSFQVGGDINGGEYIVQLVSDGNVVAESGVLNVIG